jgi:hypothetical protein
MQLSTGASLKSLPQEKVRFMTLNLANEARDEHSQLVRKHPASAYTELAAHDEQ